MKAKEFVTETINPDCFNPAFNDTQHFDGLTYRATVEEEYGKPVLTVKVLDDNFQQAGLAKFKPSKAGVVSLITSFRPEYQGQGLARNIYAYVRALGNTIVPSRNQLPAGRAMWDAWKKSGDAKHLMRDVAEGILGSDPNRGQKVPGWAKGGIVGKIGRKLDPAWSDVQMTVPQHLLSKQSSVPATNSPATKDMPKSASITPTRAIPQSAGTKLPQPATKNVVKTIADKQGVAEGSSYNIDQDDHDEFTPDEIVRIKNSHFPDTLRDNLRAAKKEARRAKHFSSSSDGGDSKLGSPVGSASDNTYEGVAEGLSEMDNRTPSGDRREQRANSPEAKAKQDKERQNRLKNTSPEMRKKLRLPEPKQGVAEGLPGSLSKSDYTPGATVKNPNTSCKRCNGRGTLWKAPDGKILPANDVPGAKKYKCGACDGIGMAKKEVDEGENWSKQNHIREVHFTVKEKGVAENNHWHAAGVADARRDVKQNPDRKVKKLNPRTHLKTMQYKQARHPEEVEQYSLGYRSINPAESICSLEEAHEIFDDFEQAMAERGLTEDAFDTVTDEQIIRETAAWRRKAGKSAKGGLNRKGVASYRRENPGSKLQMAVTTKPSKLKPGSKAAKRRKSFCARMSGVKGPMKKPNGKPTRKALALRKWNC